MRGADSNGETVPRPHPLLRFSIAGPGEIVAVDNGDATSFEPFQANQRKAFNGLALVILRAKPGSKGVIQLTAASDGFKPSRISVKASQGKELPSLVHP